MLIKNPQRKIRLLAGIIGILLIVPMCIDMISGFVLGFNAPEISTVLEYDSYPLCFEITPASKEVQKIESNYGELGFIDIKREGVCFMPEHAVSGTLTLINTIISFAALFCALYYIVSVIKLVPIIAREGFMNRPAIRLLQHVSYSMLLSYLLFAAATYLPTWYYSRQLDLADYEMAYPRMSDSIVIAIILILLTEILRVALRLKEEQELTI